MFGGKLFNAIIQKCSNAMMGVIYKAQSLNGKVIANSCDSSPPPYLKQQSLQMWRLFGAPCGTRTRDLMIKSHMLYQLS
jgi:hypothetical protein